VTQIPTPFIGELDQSASELDDYVRQFATVAAAHGRGDALRKIGAVMKAKYGPVSVDHVVLLLVAIEKLAQRADGAPPEVACVHCDGVGCPHCNYGGI
jgi:hypothetical protein